jgi:hypothetical protein
MSSQWFAYDQLNERPGLITHLLDQEFELVRPWGHLGAEGVNGRPVLLRWQVGARGVVCAIHFRNRRGWEVLMEYRGDMRGMEADEVWPVVPLQDFLICCAPLGAQGSHDLSKGAANDE